MYFKPPQNNHNDFYHPLNQVNEEKQFKARIAFMGEPKDNARDMRAAGRMKMYDTATERDVPSKRKSTVFDITFKSERQFNQFMGAYDVEFLDRLDEAYEMKGLGSKGLRNMSGTKKVNGEKAREVLTSAKVPHSMVMGTIRVPARFVTIAKKKLDDAFGGMFQKKTGFKVSGTMKEDVEIDEAVKTKVEKTSQGFQVMVFSPKVKKFIPQGSPHKTKAEAEKDAKMFEDVQLDETNFRFPQPGEYYGDLGKSILDDPYYTMSKAELKKRSDEIQRKFASVMRKHKRTKVGEVLDLLAKDGERKVYQDSDIKLIKRYLTKFKDNVRKVAHQMMIDFMEGDDYLAKKRIPIREERAMTYVIDRSTKKIVHGPTDTGDAKLYLNKQIQPRKFMIRQIRGVEKKIGDTV